LAAVKGVGGKAVEAVIDARDKDGPFEDLYDFCERIDQSAVNRAAVEALVKCGAFDSTKAKRKGMLDALDEAMKMGSGLQRDRRTGQATMFEAFGAEPVATTRSISDEDWPEPQKLAFEKATLGFYVTAHPLSQHADVLQKYASVNSTDLETLEENADVVLGGMITRVRTTTTKNGRSAGSKMAFVTLEDLKGSVEAVVFSSDFERFGTMLKAEELVFLRGRVDRRREQPSLRVSEVIEIDRAPEQLTETVLVRIDCSLVTEQALHKLAEICRAHPGSCPLVLEMTTAAGLTGTIKCNGQMGGVCPNAQFRGLTEELLGSEHLVLIAPSRRARSIPEVEQPAEAEDALLPEAEEAWD
jgi:DNA polymerase-3 subunit alpha